MTAEDGGQGTDELDLDAYITELRGLLAAAAPGSQDEGQILPELAFALVNRYESGSDCTPSASVSLLDEALALVEVYLARHSPDAEDRASALFILAFASYHRSVLRQDPADLDAAASALYEIVGRQPGAAPGDASPLEAWELLGEVLALRYRLTEGENAARFSGLSEAIRIHEIVFQSLADDAPAKVAWALDLGVLYSDRYDWVSTGTTAASPGIGTARRDLDGAIDSFRWVCDVASDDDALLAEATVRLGHALADRAVRWGNAPGDVVGSISALTRARQLLPPGDDRHAVTALHLGVMFGIKFTMHGGSPQERKDGIAALRDALDGKDLPPESAVLGRVWLAQLLLFRVVPAQLGAGSPAEMDLAEVARLAPTLLTEETRAEAGEAVRYLSEVADAGSPDAEAAVAALLGSALIIRGTAGLPAADLDSVIECFATAIRHATPGDPGLPEITAMHAWVLAERASRPGRESDISPAAERLAAARDLLPGRHPLRPVVLHYLGVMQGRLAMRRSDPAGLAAGIVTLTEALDQMPTGHPLRAETIGILAAAFISGVQFDVSAVPLDKVIGLLEEVRTHPHLDPSKQIVHLCCYGQALHLRAVRDHAFGDFPAAVEMVKQAADKAGTGHHLYPFLMFTLGSMLADQYTYQGSLESLDAASYYLDEVIGVLERTGGPVYNPEAVDLTSARAVRGEILLSRGARHQDPSLLDDAIADLRFALDELPPHSPMRGRLASELGTAQLGRAALRGDMAGIWDAGPDIISAAEQVPSGHSDRGALQGRAGLICVGRAWWTRDRALLDKGVALLEAATTDPGLAFSERARLMWGLGYGLVMRFDVTANPSDLDRGITWLEKARQALAEEPGNPVAAHVFAQLAEAYHRRAHASREDADRAIEAGIAALRESAADVLLQTGTQRALAMARGAVLDAAEVASWSIDAGRLDMAVEALELGRGLVLHASTVTTDLATVLSDAGHGALAAEWGAATSGAGPATPAPWDMVGPDQPGGPPQPGEREARTLGALAGDLPGMTMPSDLRHRVLTALAGSAAERALLSPPSMSVIVTAMRASATGALVYLLPAGDNTPGRAVVIQSDGTGQTVLLPALKTGRHGRADTYAQAHQKVLDAEQVAPGSPASQQAHRRWAYALGDLCDWAWTAAMVRVLEAASAEHDSGPLPRITLIPFGMLGMVPWHAARSHSPSGPPRYACQQAVLSYAASARQLVAAADRGPTTDGVAAFVSDPVGGGYWADAEVKYILAAYYPSGHHLQPSGTGGQAMAARVLQWLPGQADSPGASLLHLSCHAHAGTSPATSHLQLSTDESLPLDLILRQAERRPAGTHGGLIVLSACVSDLSMHDYDEALTLATAFFTAGAAGVVGTRWRVPDVRTAILMFMFHYYLSGGQPPACALRLAQVWMLDPERAVPPEMPGMLADEVPLSDLRDIVAWAGFTHQGR